MSVAADMSAATEVIKAARERLQKLERDVALERSLKDQWARVARLNEAESEYWKKECQRLAAEQDEPASIGWEGRAHGFSSQADPSEKESQWWETEREQWGQASQWWQSRAEGGQRFAAYHDDSEAIEWKRRALWFISEAELNEMESQWWEAESAWWEEQSIKWQSKAQWLEAHIDQWQAKRDDETL